MDKFKNRLKKSSGCMALKLNKEDCNISQTNDSGIVSDQSSVHDFFHLNANIPYQNQMVQYSRNYLPPPNSTFVYPLPYPHQIYPSHSIHNIAIIKPNSIIDYGPIHPYMKTTVHQNHSDAYTSVATSQSSSSSCSIPSSTSSSESEGQSRPALQFDTQSTTSELFIPRRTRRKLLRKSKTPTRKITITETLYRWDRLPYRILMNIFSKLSIGDVAKCSQVCRNWYFIAWQPGLWRTIDFSFWLKSQAANRKSLVHNVNKSVQNLIYLLGGHQKPFCPLIDVINLEKCLEITDETVLLIAEACPNLKTINLKKCTQITNLAIFSLLSKCKLLTHLNLEGCKLISSINILPEVELTISTKFELSNLTWLNLSYCQAVDDSSLCIMASRFRSLERLFLRNLCRVSDTGIKYLVKFCFKLVELSLNHLNLITDESIMSLSASAGSSITYLSLANCPLITDNSLISLGYHCKCLQYLNLHRCSLITDMGITTLARALAGQLISLNISWCHQLSNVSIESLAQYCHNIQQLDFSNCLKITDDPIVRLISQLNHLKLLNIDKTSVSMKSLGVIDQINSQCQLVHTVITDC